MIQLLREEISDASFPPAALITDKIVDRDVVVAFQGSPPPPLPLRRRKKEPPVSPVERKRFHGLLCFYVNFYYFVASSR